MGDTQSKIGKLANALDQRDAIHVAVVPVQAAKRLSPGRHVGLEEDGRASGLPAPIGVVDPFLDEVVLPNEWFWLFLYPLTITSLRHDWTHPAFEKAPATTPPTKALAEAGLRAYAEEFGVGYDALLDACRDKNRGGFGIRLSSDIPNESFEKAPEMWRFYEVLTGDVVDEDTRTSAPFWCSC